MICMLLAWTTVLMARGRLSAQIQTCWIWDAFSISKWDFQVGNEIYWSGTQKLAPKAQILTSPD